MAKLLLGNELELVVSAAAWLGDTTEHVNVAARFLSRRCERLGKWQVGVDLLKSCGGNKLELAQLCARCAASMSEKNELYARAGFVSMDDCRSKGQKTSSGVLKRVMYYMMSTSPVDGLELGLKHVKGQDCIQIRIHLHVYMYSVFCWLNGEYFRRHGQCEVDVG